MSKLIDRQEVLEDWTTQQMESMDMKSMYQLCYDFMYEYLDDLEDDDLIDQINEIDKDFLEGHIK